MSGARGKINYWVVVYRLAWGLLVVLFGVGLVCAFLPKCHRVRELQRRKAVLQQENRRIETVTRDLAMKQERFRTDPAFVERTAREEGMAKPHETVFRFTNEQSRVNADPLN